MGEDVVKKLSTRGVFEDDPDVLVGLYDVVEADDVGVLEDLGCIGVSVGGAGYNKLTLRTSISRSILDMRRALSTFPLRMSFTATSSPQVVWRPSFTLPNSPSPRVWRRRYGPNFGICLRGWAAA